MYMFIIQSRVEDSDVTDRCNIRQGTYVTVVRVVSVA